MEGSEKFGWEGGLLLLGFFCFFKLDNRFRCDYQQASNAYTSSMLILTQLSTFCVGSSLYYDEDGDLAHEFYEETVVTKNGRKKSKLKRIQKNLIPQVS